jgi:RimJ/RimL family protein N-acetyltransferase
VSPPRLRLARPADALAIWRWNNDVAVRALSRSRDPIPLSVHSAWFERRVGSATSPIFIIEDAEVPVGVVRFEPAPAGGALTISIALAPEARGKGFGRLAVTAACRAVGGLVEAWIDPSNGASLACFEAAGFAHHDTRREGGRDFRVYTWRNDDATDGDHSAARSLDL